MCFSTPKMPDFPPPPPPPAPPPPPLAMAEKAPTQATANKQTKRRRGTQQLTARRRPTIGAGMGGGTGVNLPT